uniref:TNFR-Cys domain-containing protein n=1 Tax=Branchiostoma floridae TaxID=7739 RepID=C3XTP6_BRAFL|eukprot:XP_002612663.1 hypothetical protein BRAFLDRAFT_78706 [Branchiostoma floridae]
MLAAKLCIGISIVIVAVVASLPVSSQATETPDWCPDDSTGTFQLPSGVICNLCPPAMLAAKLCIGISIVIVAVVASLPVSSQATETQEWCPDDSTGTIQLPSGVICNLCPPAHSRSAPVSDSVMQATTNIEAIIGGSVGGCLLALCLLIAGCIWWRRCGRKHPDDRGRAVPCDYTGIEMQHRQEPGPAPRVSSRPATPPSTPDPGTFQSVSFQ